MEQREHSKKLWGKIRGSEEPCLAEKESGELGFVSATDWPDFPYLASLLAKVKAEGPQIAMGPGPEMKGLVEPNAPEPKFI